MGKLKKTPGIEPIFSNCILILHLVLFYTLKPPRTLKPYTIIGAELNQKNELEGDIKQPRQNMTPPQSPEEG